jgi:hypothetical protein
MTTGEARRKQRAEVILALGSGLHAVRAAEFLGVHGTVVYRWRDRFLAGGLDALNGGISNPCAYGSRCITGNVEIPDGDLLQETRQIRRLPLRLSSDIVELCLGCVHFGQCSPRFYDFGRTGVKITA